MTFIPQESYSKKDLVECGNGALFTKDGDGRLPSDQMLMFVVENMVKGKSLLI